MQQRELGFMTRALHAEGHQKPFHAHTMPIFQTSTFYFDDAQHGADLFAKRRSGHIYTRIGNPTIETFERVVADLEGAQEAIAFSSGMAAIFGSLMSHLRAGDHLVSGDTLYGPSVNLLGETLARYGIETTFADTSDLAAIERAWRPNTRVLFLETPANPTCRITDLQGAGELVHSRNGLVMVDGTFATPYFQRPLELGADVSLHSTTKYINGHGDAVGGIAAAAAEQAGPIRKFRQDAGACPAPLDAFLNLRGLRTLGLRMERHNSNALAVARFLRGHPKISRVYFHGLEDDPGHALALRQMSGFGATFSFEMKGGFDAARKLLEGIHLMTLAVSLGTLDTLIQHPASMTHASVPEPLMRRQGLTPEMVRIHVGIEDVDDILADLSAALERVLA